MRNKGSVVGGGVSQSRSGGWYDSVELKLDIFKDYKVFFIEDVEDHTEIRKPIKHLHQLQNLYFALTGTELKIEL